MAGEYYTVVILIVIFSMVIMMTIVGTNNYLDSKKKKGFIISYALIIVVAICECFGNYLDGLPNTKELHLIVKFLELSITPTISVICAHNIFKDHKLNRIFLAVVLTFHGILEFFSMFYRYIFYVDANGVYHHSKLYLIYLIACALSVVYLFVSAKRFNHKYQNKNAQVLDMILMFMALGVSVQFYNSDLKVDWLVVCIASMFIYIHYNELVQYVDGLTQLLNQRSYLSYTRKLNNTAIVIVFDVNNFKKVNDSYGHQFGDQCLIEISRVIKKTYGKDGTCYRIGGDEFCVILENNIDNIDVLNKNFKNAIEKVRLLNQNMPRVSLGYAVFNPGFDDIRDIVELADKYMYIEKEKARKL